MRVARYALVASVVTFVLVSAPIALRAQRTAAQPAAQPAAAQPARSIASQTAGMERHDGFIPFYYDEHTGKLLLEVQRLGQDFLYLPTLATGLGSNELGLDRGTTGDEAIVRFERFGPRVLLIRQNTRYRGDGRLAPGARGRGVLRHVDARRHADRRRGRWAAAGRRDGLSRCRM